MVTGVSEYNRWLVKCLVFRVLRGALLIGVDVCSVQMLS